MTRQPNEGTTEWLVRELEAHNVSDDIITRAKANKYHECWTEDHFPLMNLHRDLVNDGQHFLAFQVTQGWFEATPEEWEEWGRTEEGQAVKGMLKEMGL